MGQWVNGLQQTSDIFHHRSLVNGNPPVALYQLAVLVVEIHLSTARPLVDRAHIVTARAVGCQYPGHGCMYLCNKH